MSNKEEKQEEVVKISAERPWKDIPEELLQSIANLSVSDRTRFRFTCKQWKTMKLPPRSVPLHIENTFESLECPWLMFYNSNDSGDCTYFHPVSNQTYLTPISELTGATICYSKHGWLLMCRDYENGNSLFFFHPIKKALINLPNSPHLVDVTGFSFSSPPTSPDCVVFAISRSWHMNDYKNDEPFFASNCNIVFYNGVFYCLGEDGKLGCFDPFKDTWKVIPKLRGPNMLIYMNFIAECNGDLISVFLGKSGTSICVFQLDWNQMKWVKLGNLANRMMFVSRTTSLLVPAVSAGTENKIYLPRFREKKNVFYSLSSFKYQSFDDDYRGENGYNTFQYMNCIWIDLNSNRIESNNHPYSNEELDWLSNAPEVDFEDDTEGE